MTADDGVDREAGAAASRPEAAAGTAPGHERLAGRRVLVVGGGQQDHGLDDPPIGNGRAMSVLFDREGAAVAVADINREGAEATAELVRAAAGEPVGPVADAADADDVAAMFAAAREARD